MADFSEFFKFSVLEGKMSSSGGGNSTNAISLKPIEVPQALQNGEKFIKWDEVRHLHFPFALGVFLNVNP